MLLKEAGEFVCVYATEAYLITCSEAQISDSDWISVGSISCPSKKSIGWEVGVKITSRRYYDWHRPNFNQDECV
jgi:hypothetical protein